MSWSIRLSAALAVMLALAVPARAEIEKFMNYCDGKLCPSFELKATPPEGWFEDKAESRKQKVRIFLPRGRSFGNAGALFYVKVSYDAEKKELAEFVRVSQSRWRENVSDAKIEKLAEVARKSGKPAFALYRFENPSRPQQAFEMVAYGEDTDKEGNRYFVMVVLTGMDRTALGKAEAPYRAMLQSH